MLLKFTRNIHACHQAFHHLQVTFRNEIRYLPFNIRRGLSNQEVGSSQLVKLISRQNKETDNYGIYLKVQAAQGKFSHLGYCNQTAPSGLLVQELNRFPYRILGELRIRTRISGLFDSADAGPAVSLIALMQDQLSL